MFDAWCEGCEQTVFLSVRRIAAISSTPEGVHVEFLCRCGHRGSWTADGEPRAADPTAASDDTESGYAESDYAAATITATML